MVTFYVAFKNNKTIEWAKRTGNAGNGWVRCSAFLGFCEAQRLFQSMKPAYPNSALAVFSNHEDEPVAWYDREPRYIFNRHVLVADAPISSAVAGLINARESDWF